jgi:hypothetical protein
VLFCISINPTYTVWAGVPVKNIEGGDGTAPPHSIKIGGIMFRLVLMSNGWHCLKIDDVESDIEAIKEFVESGDIVVLTDDVDYFADSLDMDIEDIIQVD